MPASAALIRTALAATAVAVLALATPSLASALPDVLSLKLERMPNSEVALGQPAGEARCTGDGDARSCETPIGYYEHETRDLVDVVDPATGVRGMLQTACRMIFSGTSVAYQNAPGLVNGSGWGVCHAWYALDDGRRGFGEFLTRRTVTDNVQTKETEIRMATYGGVSFATAILLRAETSPWTPPLPLSQGPAAKQGDDAGILLTFKPAKRPLVRFTSFGSFVPPAQALPVRITAAPASRCSATISGRNGRVVLKQVVTDAEGAATIGRIPARLLTVGSTWTARASCAPRAGGPPTPAKARFTVRDLAF